MSAANVWERIFTLAAGSVGGEPATQARALQCLLERARAAGWRSEMQTSDSVDPSRILGLLDLVTVSPKAPNSGVSQEHRLRTEVLRTLTSDPRAVWKFVVESDLDEIDDLVRTYGLDPVLHMAQANTRTESQERTSRIVPLTTTSRRGCKSCCGATSAADSAWWRQETSATQPARVDCASNK